MGDLDGTAWCRQRSAGSGSRSRSRTWPARSPALSSGAGGPSPPTPSPQTAPDLNKLRCDLQRRTASHPHQAGTVPEPGGGDLPDVRLQGAQLSGGWRAPPTSPRLPFPSKGLAGPKGPASLEVSVAGLAEAIQKKRPGLHFLRTFKNKPRIPAVGNGV